jgi:hypothetical protein
MLQEEMMRTLREVARYFDQRKVGDLGALGFRRSTDLARLMQCLPALLEGQFLIPGESLFLDMGCADGRVNLFMGYLVRTSIGIELDEWTLEEYQLLMPGLEGALKEKGLPLPPHNIRLFHGDTLDESIHESIARESGLSLEDYDLFYTYLTMCEEFGELIRRKAKKGSLFMLYGVERIMPRLKGFSLITPVEPLGGILALYRKE